MKHIRVIALSGLVRLSGQKELVKLQKQMKQLGGSSRWIYTGIDAMYYSGMKKARQYLWDQVIRSSKYPEDQRTYVMQLFDLSKKNGKADSKKIGQLKKIILNRTYGSIFRGSCLIHIYKHDQITAKDIAYKLMKKAAYKEKTDDQEGSYDALVSATIIGTDTSQQAEKLLTSILKSKSHNILLRSEAVKALVWNQIRDPSSVLIEMLNDISEKREMRSLAAKLLGNYSDPEVTKVLIQTLSDRDGWVAFQANTALQKISGETHFCNFLGNRNNRKEVIAVWKKHFDVTLNAQ